MHLHAHKLCGAHELWTRAEPCDWSADAQGFTTMLGGVTAGQAPHNSSNVGVATAGQVGHNSSSYNGRMADNKSTTVLTPFIIYCRLIN